MRHLEIRRSFLVVLAVGFALALLALPVHAADSPDLSSVQTPALSVELDVAGDLFVPEPAEKVTAPKYGPCTMTFQCSSACGGRFISCSGQDYCQMGYGPGNPWCSQNIYVQCDDQDPVYCIGSLELE